MMYTHQTLCKPLLMTLDTGSINQLMNEYPQPKYTIQGIDDTSSSCMRNCSNHNTQTNPQSHLQATQKIVLHYSKSTLHMEATTTSIYSQLLHKQPLKSRCNVVNTTPQPHPSPPCPYQRHLSINHMLAPPKANAACIERSTQPTSHTCISPTKKGLATVCCTVQYQQQA